MEMLIFRCRRYDHVVGFMNFMEKIQPHKQFQQIGIGTTAATSDLTNLRDAINGYSATTGIRATLNADKNAIVLVQDEGLDIVIENLDFASVTTV